MTAPGYRPSPAGTRPIGRLHRWSLPARRLPRRRARTTAELTVAAATAQWILLGIVGLAAWLCVFGLGLSSVQEHHQQHDLYARFRQQLADSVAPVGGVIRRGDPVAVFRSPHAGLNDLVAVEGTSSDVLRAGPGHVPGSALPGQAGVSTFFGRSASFGGPFGSITRLAKGDRVTVTTGQGVFAYSVLDVRRAGDPFPPPLAPGGSQLTLVTCEGSGWRSSWAPTHAVFVDALLTGKTVPGAGSASVRENADAPMQGSTATLYPLVLWLQLLLLAVIGLVIGRFRWGVWQAWLAGVPVLIAALWGASQSAWPLLPNLL